MKEEPTEVDRWITTVEQMPDQAKSAIASAEDTAELVDVVGTLHSTISVLGGIKRRAASEIESGDAGRRWMLTQGRVAKRSYNTMALIIKFQRKWRHPSAIPTISQLVDDGVLEFKWNWKKLEALADDYDIPISSVTGRKAESGCDFDVGVQWGNASPKYEPVDAPQT